MATVIREGTFTKTIYGFIRDQKYEDAIQVLTYQLQLFPRSRAALSLLAYSYFFAGDFPNAVQTYEMLVKFYPNVTRYKIYYAQSLLRAGLYEEATKNSLRVKEEEYEQRMLKLRAHVKYEQDDVAGCRAIVDQCIQDDPDTIISYACIEFKNSNFDAARKLFVDAIGALGYQPDLAYNVALCYYKLKQYGSALKHLGEIVEKGVRFHPELSIGSNNEMTAARSVGNSQLLKETALIEAFNLKAAIEYNLNNISGARLALNDMPPRTMAELDRVSLHNQALINIDEDATTSFEQLNYLLNNPPFPPPTFTNLLMLYCKYSYHGLAADVLAENPQYHALLSPEVKDFLNATIMVPDNPAEAYRKFDDLTKNHIKDLRKYTKRIQDARMTRDNTKLREALKTYDTALAKFMPVLMAQAKIYWDRGNYPQVERIFRSSAEFCSESDPWKLNVAHNFFLQENKFKDALSYYSPFVERYRDNILDVSAIILANLCVSYIMISQNENAEELMRTIEKEEDQLMFNEPDKKCYHLCIVNLVIGTLYCSKGNYEFGVSRIIKSLEPLDRRLGTDTWFHAKRCFVALAEVVAKHIVALKDTSFYEIINFLERAAEQGADIPSRLETLEEDGMVKPLDPKKHCVAREARDLKKMFLRLMGQ